MKTSPLKDAVRYLSVRSRSEAEVKAFLARKKHPAEKVEDAVCSLKDEKLLDDSALAAKWADELASSCKYGKSFAVRKMVERGISKELAEEAAAEAWEGLDEAAVAEELLYRTGRAGPAEGDSILPAAKAARFLAARGFASESILKALKRAFKDGD